MSGQADGKPKAHLVLRRCGIDAEDELIANFGAGRRAKHVYQTATLDAAVWERNSPSAKERSGSTSLNRPVSSRTTRT